MDNSELDPDLQALINEERSVASTRQSSYHTLKLEKGWSAYVRILPVELGPRKSWFARIARHWVATRPIFCEKHSSADFNGDPNAHCPLCELESRYGQDKNKAIAESARRMGAFPKWLLYVYVWEVIDDRNRKTPTAKQDMYVPHEFWVTRDNYLELLNLWERSSRLLGTKMGFLDPVKGYDFFIQKDQRNGLKLHADMKGPIIPDKTESELYDLIDESMRKVKIPDHTPASPDDMEAAVEKADDLIQGRRARDDRGGGARSRVDSYEDEDGGRGGRGGRGDDAPSGGRGGRSEESVSPRGEEPAGRGRNEEPAGRGRGEEPVGRGRSEEPTGRGTAGRSSSRSEEPAGRGGDTGGRGGRGESVAETRGRTEPAQRESRRDDPPPRGEPRREEPAARDETRRTGSNPADFDASSPETPPPVSSRSRGATSSDVLPPRTRSAPPPPPEKGGRTDDPKAEEEAPRERRDAAPPSDVDPATLPATTAAAPAAAQSRLSENLRNRVQRFSPRETT